MEASGVAPVALLKAVTLSDRNNSLAECYEVIVAEQVFSVLSDQRHELDVYFRVAFGRVFAIYACASRVVSRPRSGRRLRIMQVPIGVRAPTGLSVPDFLKILKGYLDRLVALLHVAQVLTERRVLITSITSPQLGRHDALCWRRWKVHCADSSCALARAERTASELLAASDLSRSASELFPTRFTRHFYFRYHRPPSPMLAH